MRDEGMAVLHGAFDLSDDAGSDREVPERDWAIGSQPIPITEDTVHVRHLGEQTWHRVVAGSPTSLGYETACPRPMIEFSLAEWRQQCHRGEPCRDGCFTEKEIARFVPETASTWRHFEDQQRKKKDK
jgi:hypothetical protein